MHRERSILLYIPLRLSLPRNIKKDESRQKLGKYERKRRIERQFPRMHNYTQLSLYFFFLLLLASFPADFRSDGSVTGKSVHAKTECDI